MESHQLETLRHSSSHLMASAILKLFPGTKLGIGPAIDNGFYYDFQLPNPISDEDLQKIAEEMKDIAQKNLPFEKEEIFN